MHRIIICIHILFIAFLWLWKTPVPLHTHLRTQEHRVLPAAQIASALSIPDCKNVPPEESPPPQPLVVQQEAPTQEEVRKGAVVYETKKTPPPRKTPTTKPSPQHIPPKAPPPKPPPSKGTPPKNPSKGAPPKNPPKGNTPQKAHHQALAQLMEQGLKQAEGGKLSTGEKPSKETVAIGPLHCEQVLYTDRIVSFLETRLSFPEPGEVRVSIEVARNGKVTSCLVLDSLSAANRAYVSRILPTLTLPPLDEELHHVASKNFRLTLIARTQE